MFSHGFYCRRKLFYGWQDPIDGLRVRKTILNDANKPVNYTPLLVEEGLSAKKQFMHESQSLCKNNVPQAYSVPGSHILFIQHKYRRVFLRKQMYTICKSFRPDQVGITFS